MKIIIQSLIALAVMLASCTKVDIAPINLDCDEYYIVDPHSAGCYVDGEFVLQEWSDTFGPYDPAQDTIWYKNNHTVVDWPYLFSQEGTKGATYAFCD